MFLQFLLFNFPCSAFIICIFVFFPSMATLISMATNNSLCIEDFQVCITISALFVEIELLYPPNKLTSLSGYVICIVVEYFLNSNLHNPVSF